MPTGGRCPRPFRRGRFLLREGFPRYACERARNAPRPHPLRFAVAAWYAGNPTNERLEGTDACFAPVLAPVEAAAHSHHIGRANLVAMQVFCSRLRPRGSRFFPTSAPIRWRIGASNHRAEIPPVMLMA
jgi:hypothetical protein